VKYAFIAFCAGRLPVASLCDYLGVSRSGYYTWAAAELTARQQDDKVLSELIAAEFAMSRQTYGKTRIRRRLRRCGRRSGERRISRLMRANTLVARKRRRFVQTTVADPLKKGAANVLNREFSADGPNRKWVSDITVIPTDEGDLYLAITLDLWSRMVVGWAIDETMDEQLVQKAFEMAVMRRWPDPAMLHHSDQGSQYTSNGFRKTLSDHGVIESNSRRANVWDNAVMEAFFSTLEMELLRKIRFKTKLEAIQEVFSYIEIFYNRQRIHTTLGDLSPAEFEALHGN
jgi:putative transposase